jgi:hypothetical protein
MMSLTSQNSHDSKTMKTKLVNKKNNYIKQMFMLSISRSKRSFTLMNRLQLYQALFSKLEGD